MKNKIMALIFLTALSSLHAAYAYNFINRLIMGKNGMVVDEDVFFTPRIQPEWIVPVSPQFSPEDAKYVHQTAKQANYFVELEFWVNEKGDVIDVQILNANVADFKTEEILSAAKKAKMTYNFKPNTHFPFRFISSFYFLN
ncbi:energy transducer TonB [Acinetobacter sp.]|jgi:TonB family protein|uniref:energy transducer TonB family protein n=1 Tax=Acinetobacter sp. TaxID=472 RepID=UPI002816FD8B|nr:energy transducer TonB [Acinetobacter sp.]MDR0235049.1 energy transducer TonB [Acinetobacter sp.]